MSTYLVTHNLLTPLLHKALVAQRAGVTEPVNEVAVSRGLLFCIQNECPLGSLISEHSLF